MTYKIAGASSPEWSCIHSRRHEQRGRAAMGPDDKFDW